MIFFHNFILFLTRSLTTSSIFQKLHQDGIATGFQSMSEFIDSVKKEPNSHGSLNLLSDPISTTDTSSCLHKLKNITSFLRFQRNPILLHYMGSDIRDFKAIPLILDAGFYVIKVNQPDVLWSLYKIDPQNEMLLFDAIHWKTESYKLR